MAKTGKSKNKAKVARLKAELETMQAKKAAGIRIEGGRTVDEDARRAMAMIPPDTRDLTARVFGDPIPGRRALDMKTGTVA